MITLKGHLTEWHFIASFGKMIRNRMTSSRMSLIVLKFFKMTSSRMTLSNFKVKMTSGANIINLFTSVSYDFPEQARVFARIGLKSLPGTKLSSFSWKVVRYGRNKFYNIGPCQNATLHFKVHQNDIRRMTLSILKFSKMTSSRMAFSI